MAELIETSSSTTSREYWLGDPSKENGARPARLDHAVDMLLRPRKSLVRRRDSYVIPDNETAVRSTRLEYGPAATIEAGDSGRTILPVGFYRPGIPLRDVRTQQLSPETIELVRLSKPETEAFALACLQHLWDNLTPTERIELEEHGFRAPWDRRTGMDPWWSFVVGNETRLANNRRVSSLVNSLTPDDREMRDGRNEHIDLKLAVRRELFRRMNNQYQHERRGKEVTDQIVENLTRELRVGWDAEQRSCNEKAMRGFIEDQRSTVDDMQIPDLSQIWRDESDLNPALESWSNYRADLARLCSRLANGYIGAVWVPPPTGVENATNRVIEISFEEELKDEQARLKALTESRGFDSNDHLPVARVLEPYLSDHGGPLRSKPSDERKPSLGFFHRLRTLLFSRMPTQYGRLLIPSWSIADVAGFTFEVEAPPGTSIQGTSILTWPSRRWRKPSENSPSGASLSAWMVSPAEGDGRKLHLRVRDIDSVVESAPLDSRPSLLELHIIANAEKTIRIAGVIGLVALALVDGTILLLPLLGPSLTWVQTTSPDIIPTICILIPSALAAFIFFQGEHGIVSSLLQRIRLFLMGTLLVLGTISTSVAFLAFPRSSDGLHIITSKSAVYVSYSLFVCLVGLTIIGCLISAWYLRPPPANVFSRGGIDSDADRPARYQERRVGRIFTLTSSVMEAPRLWTRPGRRILQYSLEDEHPTDGRDQRLFRTIIALRTLTERIARTPTIDLPIVPHEVDLMGENTKSFKPFRIDADLVCESCATRLKANQNGVTPERLLSAIKPSTDCVFCSRDKSFNLCDWDLLTSISPG